MSSLGRIFLLVLLALLGYVAFFMTPEGANEEGRFDPDQLAADEVAVWQAASAGQDITVYFDTMVMLHDQDRYTWFRAAESGFYLARASETFADLHSRYERVLPDLEAAATVEKSWMGASFDPAAVARAQLNWWVTRRMPNLNSIENVAPIMADEYSLRYQMSAGRVLAAATLRTEAVTLRDDGGSAADWRSITRRLADSYRALQSAIERAHAPA